jgi:chromosome segregation protein
VVKDVDDRILEVFSSAYEDTGREFEQVFAVLFPGGEGRPGAHRPGRHARHRHRGRGAPPGKKIKRLSLLSGGERSLTAVRAALRDLPGTAQARSTSWTRSRPALDDVNLGRLLLLMEQLREKSQLIIITHQKRTMEIADALYGVTMRAGITQVISQRLRDVETAA